MSRLLPSVNVALVAFLCTFLPSSEYCGSIGMVTSFTFFTLPTKRSAMTMRKGRKSLRKTAGSGGGGKLSPLGGSEVDAPSVGAVANWVPVSGLKSKTDLPKEEGKIKLVDTMADVLIDGRTNPTGAVGIVNYDGRTYCVSAACSACKIPLTKAKILPPSDETNGHPRLECDFCGSTYNARTGDLVADGNTDRGLLGGVVKGLFASGKKGSLPTYDLGEKNGRIMINLP